MNNVMKYVLDAMQRWLVSRIKSSASGQKNGNIRLRDVVEAIVTLILAISCLLLVKHLVDIWYKEFISVLISLT